MDSNNGNPQIEFCNLNNTNCLKFSFNGELAESEAKVAVNEWKHLFESKNGAKLTLVWDCNKMTGYDPGARLVWQNALNEFKNQISSIWVVSKSNMIRSGAMIIAMLTNYNIKVVQTESELFVS